MTCIVGIVDQLGDVWMGGDSAAIETSTHEIRTVAEPKVFINGDFLIGYSGSFRVGQLLRYAFVPPDQPSKKDDLEYMVTDFIDALRTLQRDKGTLNRGDNDEESHNVHLLVGYNNKIYVIEDDFQVYNVTENYIAIGKGSDLALGAMYATQNLMHDPRERLMLALRASAEFSATVRAPFHIMKLHGDV